MVFLAGFIDSVAGGGGLISLPAYMVAGVPPHLATATNKCSSTFGTLVSTLRFMKGKRIHYLTAGVSAVAAWMGSILGALLNQRLDEKYLQMVLIVIIPVITVIIMVKKELGDHSEIEKLSTKKIVLESIVIGFVIGTYDGFLGPGTGTFLILCYCAFMKFDVVTASGNAKVVNLASNVAALITFAMHGSVLWKIGLPAAIFGIAGNYLGSGLAIKNGKKIIKPIFILVLGILLIKLVYDLM